jgi:hypothetical protein
MRAALSPSLRGLAISHRQAFFVHEGWEGISPAPADGFERRYRDYLSFLFVSGPLLTKSAVFVSNLLATLMRES